VTFACLATLFLTDQFQYKYVFAHSEKVVELQYKVAAIWSGQEGSFLLWAVCSALFGLAAAPRTGKYRTAFTIPYALFLAALAGILSYESPFKLERIDGQLLVPPSGVGLSPSLLNYWVTIHPPTIFLGFGSLTVLFCWAIAALAKRDLDSWIRPIRPWVLVSLTLVGLGLCMGGFWAYETLGWGGFWAWDPVENVSFVPWVLLAALTHGIFVQVAKKKWHWINVLLAASPFLAFGYGTFLTRSGFLSEASVHSFAQMDRSALWLLVGVVSASFIGLGAFWIPGVLRARRTPAPTAIEAAEKLGVKVDRSAAYAAGMWLLAGLAVATGIGMSVPFIMGVLGRPTKVVEEGLYHQVLVWFFIPIILLMAAGPFISWRKMGVGAVLGRLANILAISLGLLGLCMLWAKLPISGWRIDPERTLGTPFGAWDRAGWGFVLTGLCLFAIVANVWRMIQLWRVALPALGGYVMHLGVAVSMLGLIVSRGFERSERYAIQEGSPGVGMGYEITSIKPEKMDLLSRKNTLPFRVVGPREDFVARPGLYYIQRPNAAPEPMVWPYVKGFGWYDLYFTLHPLVFEATEGVTLKPNEQRLIGQSLLTYKGLRREGEPGQAGTKFYADVTLETPQGTFTGSPALVLGGTEGLQIENASLGPDFYVTFSDPPMDAATQSATIQLLYVHPVMPVELFFKPLTILVWLGAGMMTLGGLIAAWYRRREVRSADARLEVQEDAA